MSTFWNYFKMLSETILRRQTKLELFLEHSQTNKDSILQKDKERDIENVQESTQYHSKMGSLDGSKTAKTDIFSLKYSWSESVPHELKN